MSNLVHREPNLFPDSEGASEEKMSSPDVLVSVDPFLKILTD